MDVKVPSLADNVTSGTVVSIFVKEGDEVQANQDLMELETEKAVAPIPAPSAGRIGKILVKEGDNVAVGQTIITLANGTASAAPAKESAPETKLQAPTPTPAAPVAPATPVAQPAPAPGAYQYQSKSGFPPPASPSVRKMAAQIGLDLTRVPGSGHGGRITLEDVRNYVAALQSGTAQAAAPAAGATRAPLPSVDFSKWGKIEKKPLTTLRKKIAEKMTQSWTTVPAVTQFADADITDLMKLNKKHAPAFEKQGARLTVTVLILKALVPALKNHPIFNSSIDENTEELILKHYINFGIAVDTEQGLIVPVIKNVDQMNAAELAIALAELAEKTRSRKVGLNDLQGGTFTISNQGSIGGSHFTPIINVPEVAIIGLGRGQKKPLFVNKELKERVVLPIALTYDHRVIDGGNAARFITEFTAALENYDESLLEVESGSKKKTSSKPKAKKGKK